MYLLSQFIYYFSSLFTKCWHVHFLTFNVHRFWYSSAAYAIAQEANCGDESSIPPKGHSIYQWPSDLLRPSAVICLVLNEEERQVRMGHRGCPETNEEANLTKSQLLRERQVIIIQYRVLILF